MESLKRGYPPFNRDEDNVEPFRENKRPRLVSSDPVVALSGQVFVQVLLAPQFDLSTTAWMFARVSRRWRDAIRYYTPKRWMAHDRYSPFHWTAVYPITDGGLVPPVVPLFEEWSRQGWLGMLQWAHGLGFPMLHKDDKNQWGTYTHLKIACRGGHRPVVAWMLDGLGAHLDTRGALEGACRSGNDALLRWLVEDRCINPRGLIPWDENPASWGNLETCKWLFQKCHDMDNGWLTGAGRNDHRHILEWAHTEGYAIPWLVWHERFILLITLTGARSSESRKSGYAGMDVGTTGRQSERLFVEDSP